MSLDYEAAADAALVYADSGVSATWKHGGDHSVAAATLTETPDFTDDTVTIVRAGPVTKREIMAGVGVVEGDQHFKVLASDLTSTPQADDEIAIGSDTWYVVSFALDQDQIEYDVIVRKT